MQTSLWCHHLHRNYIFIRQQKKRHGRKVSNECFQPPEVLFLCKVRARINFSFSVHSLQVVYILTSALQTQVLSKCWHLYRSTEVRRAVMAFRCGHVINCAWLFRNLMGKNSVWVSVSLNELKLGLSTCCFWGAELKHTLWQTQSNSYKPTSKTPNYPFNRAAETSHSSGLLLLIFNLSLSGHFLLRRHMTTSFTVPLTLSPHTQGTSFSKQTCEANPPGPPEGEGGYTTDRSDKVQLQDGFSVSLGLSDPWKLDPAGVSP